MTIEQSNQAAVGAYNIGQLGRELALIAVTAQISANLFWTGLGLHNTGRRRSWERDHV